MDPVTVLIGGLVVVALLAVIGVYVALLRKDQRDLRSRTERHREAGGRPGDAPDWIPGHLGGSGGG